MTQLDLVATFAREGEVLAAARDVRERGAKIVDAYTPYAVHGLDEAMGLEPSKLPWVTFACGLAGLVIAVAFQIWTSAYDWALDVGGKPLLSLPAFVPVDFETTILLAGIGSFVAMFVGCGLFPGRRAGCVTPAEGSDCKPASGACSSWKCPSRGQARMRATDDQFTLVLRANDPRFSGVDVRDVLRRHGAFEITEQADRKVDPARHDWLTIPRLVLILAALGSGAAVVALEIGRHVLAGPLDERNFEALPNMVESVPYDAFDENPNFPDHRTLRPPVPETVARGFLPLAKKGEVPNPVPDTPPVIERGKKVFAVYCTPCHGPNGKGDGTVVAHGGVAPPSLLTDRVKGLKDKIIYNIISNGLGNMPPHGAQIERDDRWKVVRYLRTLKEQP